MFSLEGMRNSVKIALNNGLIREDMIVDQEMMEFLIGIKFKDVQEHVFRMYAMGVKSEIEKEGIFCSFKGCENYELRCEPKIEAPHIAELRYLKAKRLLKKTTQTLKIFQNREENMCEIMKCNHIMQKNSNRLFALSSVLN